MKKTMFIFRKRTLSALPNINGTDVDFLSIPASSLVSMNMAQREVILYFVNGNSYTKFTGGTTNVRGYEYAQVVLSVDLGDEMSVIYGISEALSQDRSNITLDNVNQVFDLERVNLIGSIKRFENLSILDTDPGLITEIEIEDVDGTVRTVPVNDNVCEWKTITVVDQDDNVLATQTTYPAGGEIEVTASSTTTYPQIIYHRDPSYPSAASGDYPDLFASGYFDLYRPSIGVEMIQLGADNYTLAANNRYGNTSRYTATDGTPSNTGTARFSSYGSGVANVVRDNYLSIMWYNIPFGSSSTTLANSQAEADAANASSLAGFTDWIVPTRDMLSLSASPDNNQAIHTSPNLIIDTGTRRYMTCERLPYINQGYQVYFSNGGESSQSLTTTASGQNRVVIARIMSLTELFG